MKKISLLLLFFAVLLTGCRTTRRVPSSLDGANPERARFEYVVRSAFTYDALQAKSRYTFGSTSLSGKYCLESGQRLCMQVNAPMLGFEIARAEISQQVLIVDKYDKAYCIQPLADLYQLPELSGHEIEVLECLMLGRIYLPGYGLAVTRHFDLLQWRTTAATSAALGYSTGTFTRDGYTLSYSIDSTGRLIRTVLTVGSRVISCDYSDYQEVEKGKVVPMRTTFTLADGASRSLQFSLSLSNPQFGESTWRDFEANSTYRQITLDELLTIVKALMK